MKGLQDPNNLGGHLPSMSSLNHSESNSQSGPPGSSNHFLTTNAPGSVGQISSSISILNPETPTSNGEPSPGGSSYGDHYSASPSPSLTGSTNGQGTSTSRSEMTQHYGHNPRDRGPGSSGSGSLDQFPTGNQRLGFKSSPGRQGHSPSPLRASPPMSTPPPMSNIPIFPHLSMAQFHSHLRSSSQHFSGGQPLVNSPQLIMSHHRSRSPETRFQELF